MSQFSNNLIYMEEKLEGTVWSPTIYFFITLLIPYKPLNFFLPKAKKLNFPSDSFLNGVNDI